MTSLINGEQVWLMWMSIVIIASISIWLEQTKKWASKIAAATIAIFGAMLLVNLRILPSSSPVYSSVYTYVLPLALPLLLFKCNIKKIVKESKNLFLVFNIAALGAVAGTILSGFLFKSQPGIGGIMAMETGAFIGGTVNLVAMGNVYHVNETYISAVAVAANLFVTFLLVGFIAVTETQWVRKTFRHPYIDMFEANLDPSKGLVAAQYWKAKNISLLSIAKSIMTTFVICGFSFIITSWVNTLGAPLIIQQLFGNIFLLITTITAILVTIFPKFFETLEGSEEIGLLMIMLYFVSIGGAADLSKLATIGPVVIITITIVILIQVAILLVLAKVFKWTWEEVACASCSSIGGPTTGAALAINKGWDVMVAPSILVGLYGYIIGNYVGVFVGNLFG